MALQTEDKNNIAKLAEGSTEKDALSIEHAYVFAQTAHRGQTRLSGEPYFSHLYETALYLKNLGMDRETIAAALLHDAIEDGTTDDKTIEKEFGREILFLVQGVTKLGKVKYQGLKRHTESLRKLLIAMAEDIRVLIIKFADRLHNMKTLEFLPKEKQKRIAEETLEIYAPLAHRLGMGRLKGELEDLAFSYLYPGEYKEVKEIIEKESKKNIERLRKINNTLHKKLSAAGITVTETDFRIKHIYSTWRKLKRYDMNIGRVYDIAALRVIVPTQEDCYRTLGIIHSTWKPMAERIKDYIASPKTNGYRSLHTTIFTGDGGIIEIQIRTKEMHEEAERGVSSHVVYKEGAESHFGATSLIRTLLGDKGKDSFKKATKKLLSDLASFDPNESPQKFLKNLKTDFFGDRVFVFTPKGEVVDLPEGATAVDFAYSIHSDIGYHMAAAKINGKFGGIGSKLKNGDIVEIETRKSSKPTRKWLEYAKTALARRKIRSEIAR